MKRTLLKNGLYYKIIVIFTYYLLWLFFTLNIHVIKVKYCDIPLVLRNSYCKIEIKTKLKQYLLTFKVQWKLQPAVYSIRNILQSHVNFCFFPHIPNLLGTIINIATHSL